MSHWLHNPPTEEYTKELLEFLPPLLSYHEWVNVISAIGNTFPYDIALNLILTKYPDLKPNETEYKLVHRKMNVTFGTFIHIAKIYGYQKKLTRINRFRDSKTSCSNQYIRNKRKFEYEAKNGISCDLIKYPCELAKISPCHSEILQFRQDYAIDLIKEANKNIHFTDSIVYGINYSLINKNLNPKNNYPLKNFYNFNYKFQNRKSSLFDFVKDIGKGYAFTCCNFKYNEEGKIVRKLENVLSFQLFAIDVDNSSKSNNCVTLNDALNMDLTKYALFVYTTVNHTEEYNRYRIVFPLPEMFSDNGLYKHLSLEIGKYYNADRACTDTARAFYGNSNGHFYLIQENHEIIFKNGRQYGK